MKKKMEKKNGNGKLVEYKWIEWDAMKSAMNGLAWHGNCDISPFQQKFGTWTWIWSSPKNINSL